MSPVAPLVGFVTSGRPLLSRCMMVRKRSTSSEGPPYAAIAAITVSRQRSTFGIKVSLTSGGLGSTGELTGGSTGELAGGSGAGIDGGE